MSAFEVALDFVLVWEGGSKLTQDPDDPGGATKYGVSYRFLKNLPLADADLNQDGLVTWQDVQALTLEKASGIYLGYFWSPLHLSEFPDRLATVLFDTAVNVGRKRAATWLQQSLPVDADGAIGKKTLRAISAKLSLDYSTHKLLTDIVLARRRTHYYALACEHTWAKKYIWGWVNRVDALEAVTGAMSDDIPSAITKRARGVMP